MSNDREAIEQAFADIHRALLGIEGAIADFSEEVDKLAADIAYIKGALNQSPTKLNVIMAALVPVAVVLVVLATVGATVGWAAA